MFYDGFGHIYMETRLNGRTLLRIAWMSIDGCGMYSYLHSVSRNTVKSFEYEPNMFCVGFGHV